MHRLDRKKCPCPDNRAPTHSKTAQESLHCIHARVVPPQPPVPCGGRPSCLVPPRGIRPPVLRQSSASGLARPPASSSGRLPAIVGERLVRLGHPVDVVPALVGAALLLLGIEQLVGEPLGHRLLTPLARKV